MTNKRIKGKERRVKTKKNEIVNCESERSKAREKVRNQKPNEV